MAFSGKNDFIFYIISVEVYFTSSNENFIFTVLVLTIISITLEMMLSLAKMKCTVATTFFVPYTLALA